jgi:hypothetical protein
MASTHANAKHGYDCWAIFYASGLQLIRSFVKEKKHLLLSLFLAIEFAAKATSWFRRWSWSSLFFL